MRHNGCVSGGKIHLEVKTPVKWSLWRVISSYMSVADTAETPGPRTEKDMPQR